MRANYLASVQHKGLNTLRGDTTRKAILRKKQQFTGMSSILEKRAGKNCKKIKISSCYRSGGIALI
ncbi:hypothetical protein EO082_06805 [Aeromonas veronii]|nr:hypothetical protein EO082_06805 [Aeromonas veronii]